MKLLIGVVMAVVLKSTLSAAHSGAKDLVPLRRLYNSNSDNHFYTTSDAEANNAANSLGYRQEGSPGLVAKSASNCQCGKRLIPVYRLYKSGKNDDHFYTTNSEEATNAANNLGYIREGIAYYCSATNGGSGASLPLYRYWRGTDHFYTTNLNEGNQNVVAVGGTFEGILCYIWAP